MHIQRNQKGGARDSSLDEAVQQREFAPKGRGGGGASEKKTRGPENR